MGTTTAPAPKASPRAGRPPHNMPNSSFSWRGYQAPKVSKSTPGGVVFAIFGVAAMLVLVPLVQSITGGPPEQVTVREFNVSLPPPPPPPPEPPPPVNEVVEEPPPQMQPPPMNLSLSQLSMAINPGVGGALAGDFGLGEVNQVSSADTIQDIQLFDISELDEKPRALTNEQFDAPPRIRQQRIPIKAIVEIVINPDGSVNFTKFHEVSPSGVEESIINYVSRMRFTKPMKDGRAVSARYGIPIVINW